MEPDQQHERPLAVRIDDAPTASVWPCDRCGELTPIRGSWRLIIDDREQIRCHQCIIAEAFIDLP
jgi:hypothetical protein